MLVHRINSKLKGLDIVSYKTKLSNYLKRMKCCVSMRRLEIIGLLNLSSDNSLKIKENNLTNKQFSKCLTKLLF